MDVRVALAHQLVAAIEAAHAVDVMHLELVPSKVKFSTAGSARATILGLGSSLIVDGAEARRERILSRWCVWCGCQECPCQTVSTKQPQRFATRCPPVDRARSSPQIYRPTIPATILSASALV
jgi:hypothetical protein